MNPSSSIRTGSVTITAASLVPLISWALGGFNGPIPESVPYLLAAGAVTVSHLVVNLFNAFMAKKSVITPSVKMEINNHSEFPNTSNI